MAWWCGYTTTGHPHPNSDVLLILQPSWPTTKLRHLRLLSAMTKYFWQPWIATDSTQKYQSEFWSNALMLLIQVFSIESMRLSLMLRTWTHKIGLALTCLLYWLNTLLKCKSSLSSHSSEHQNWNSVYLHQVLLITPPSSSMERRFRGAGWHIKSLVPHKIILNMAGLLMKRL